MYIQPNTTIELFPGVPVEPSYIHTLYWDSPASQNAYFQSYPEKRVFTELSYNRVSKKSVRLQLTIGASYGVYNYMRFKNTSFENKWIYAFITKMEYVSNEVIEIEYEIDVIQTWYHDFTLNQCVVLREHTVSDNFGDNLIVEDLETGDYVTCEVEEIMATEFHDYAYAIIATQGPDGTQPYGGYRGLFYGTYFKIFSSYLEMLTELEAFKAGESQSLEPIIAIYQLPSFMASTETMQSLYTATATKWKSSFGDYTPKNKKLFTYPYSFMTVISPDGNSVNLKYEDFNLVSDEISFDVYGSAYPTPECIIKPHGYQILTDAARPVFINYAVTMSKFPTCAVASDAFSAWWAQNKNSTWVRAGTDVIQSTMHNVANSNAGDIGTLAIGMGTALSSAATNLANIWAATQDHKAVPDSVIGTANANGVLSCYSKYSCDICYQQIRSDYARSIDNYFTMYGYAIKRIKTPAFNARPHWNYVQTNGCTISGNVPADDEHRICEIFNNGITFWKNPAEVGNYNLDNSPV